MHISIKQKILVVVLVLFGLAAALLGGLLDRFHSEGTDSIAQNAVVSAQRSFAAVQQGETERLHAIIDSVTLDSDVVDLFVARDREGLAELVTPMYEVLKERQGMNRWYFYMPLSDGTVFLRAYRGDEMLDPDNYGDTSDRATYIDAAQSGGGTAGFELGKTALALRAADVIVADGEEIGVMSVGVSIDEFLASVSMRTGDEYALFLDKERFDQESWAAARESAGLADDWNDYPNVVLAQGTVDDLSALRFDGTVADIPEEGLVFDEVREGGRVLVRGAFPVYEAGGDKVAAVYVLHDMTEVTEALAAGRTAVLVGIVVLMVVLSVLVLMLLNVLVFKRLKSMIANVEDVSTRLLGGEFDVKMPEVTSRDEIGEFESFLSSFVKTVGNTMSTIAKR